MNLYRVKLQGLFSSINTNYNMSYVVAPNAEMAYQEVRVYLDKEDIGFVGERALEAVELLAEDCEYPECGTRLFITRYIKRALVAVKRKTNDEDTD